MKRFHSVYLATGQYYQLDTMKIVCMEAYCGKNQKPEESDLSYKEDSHRNGSHLLSFFFLSILVTNDQLLQEKHLDLFWPLSCLVSRPLSGFWAIRCLLKRELLMDLPSDNSSLFQKLSLQPRAEEWPITNNAAIGKKKKLEKFVLQYSHWNRYISALADCSCTK